MSTCRLRVHASILLLLGGLFWSGCPTPPQRNPRVTILHPNAVSGLSPTSVPPAASATPEPVPRPAEEKAALLSVNKLNLPAGVLPLSLWAGLCGFDQIRVVSSKAPRAVELRNRRDALVLTHGQRQARWNGMPIGLGFAPAVVSGELALNSLDVQKSIYPLAREALPPWRRNPVAVIDPGHGGSDPGSRGVLAGAVEKQLTLDWARRVERILTNSGWRVVLTRRTDEDVSLLQRVAIADSVSADLFVSLHFNSLPDSAANRDESGIETFCLTPVGMPSTVVRDFEDDASRPYPNNDFDAESLLVAARLHSSLVKAIGCRDRGVKRARFMTVLREQRRPAVLIEGGFLSTPAEASLVLRPEHRQRMAEALCAALIE